MRVIGVLPPDKQWKAMKKAYDACVAAGITIPSEITTYFGPTGPQEEGRSLILQDDTEGEDSKYVGRIPSGVEGIQIDLKKLPKDVTVLRILTSTILPSAT